MWHCKCPFMLGSNLVKQELRSQTSTAQLVDEPVDSGLQVGVVASIWG